MGSLNFKHLRYFWMVAKAGSIARASQLLHLTPQSISGQLSDFETALGIKLFHRVGRGLEITEAGRRILIYAEDIFSLGDELLDAAHDQTTKKSTLFRIGIADPVAKMVAYRLIEPALQLSTPVRLICREERLATLLADLSTHQLDMVIADRPMPAKLNVRGYDHLLGESGLAVFGTKRLVKSLPGKFPALLDNAPFLLPGEDASIRSRLLNWFNAQHLRPRIIGEFDDSALLKAFGQAGVGLFVGPSAIADHIAQQYRVEIVGRIDSVREQVYAITSERRSTHPAVTAINAAARQEIFGKIAQDQATARTQPRPT